MVFSASPSDLEAWEDARSAQCWVRPPPSCLSLVCFTFQGMQRKEVVYVLVNT